MILARILGAYGTAGPAAACLCRIFLPQEVVVSHFQDVDLFYKSVETRVLVLAMPRMLIYITLVLWEIGELWMVD